MFDMFTLPLPHEQQAVLPVLEPETGAEVGGSNMPNPPQPPK
jgi:hypothetical protein